MPEIIRVQIVRSKLTPDGYGGHNEREVAIPGSPFEARLYRRNYRSKRDDGDAGTTIRDDQRILSIRNEDKKALQILPGDIAIIPACASSEGKEERIRLQHPRRYPNGFQYDLESGNTPSAADSNTE